MTTTTRERNYRKHPHTDRFLQVFHSGIGTNGRNYRAEADDAAALALEAAEDDDLLNLVSDAPADLRTPAQRQFMDDLIGRLARLDEATGAQAREYTDRMTENGRWTSGRQGNASAWIDRMITKERQLKTTAPAQPVAPVAEVADGRYAVEEDGVLRFFKVKNGGRPGFVFLDVQASDDWHAIRNMPRLRKIVALIAEDPKAAMIRYGHELGQCGRCGRTLTDEASRAAGIGPICADK